MGSCLVINPEADVFTDIVQEVLRSGMHLIESINERYDIMVSALFEILRVIAKLHEIVEVTRAFILAGKVLANGDQRPARKGSFFLNDVHR